MSTKTFTDFYPVYLWLVLALLFSLPATAAVYRWVDSKGIAHFTDKPPEGVQVERVRSKAKQSTTPLIIKQEEIKEPNAGGIHRVILYTAPNCSICQQARDYFEQKGVTYTEYNIDKNPQGAREFRRMNAKGVPLILYGDQRMNGFSARAFKRLYK